MKVSKKYKEIVLLLFQILALGLFQPIFLFLNNIGDVRTIEFLPVVYVVGSASICIWIISSLLFKSFALGAMFSSLIIIIAENFHLLLKGVNSIIPNIKYWHLLIICIYFIVIVGVVIIKNVKEEYAKNIAQVISIVFSILIIINLFTAIPKMLKNDKQAVSNNEIVQNESIISNLEEMPNVYWLIFDEYSAFDVIEKYYGYDNVEFKDFLLNNNFNISFTSVNESQQSNTILCNYAHLDYVTDDSISYNDRADLQKQGIVFDMFEKAGYEINSLYGGAAFGLEDEFVSSTTMSGETFSDLIYKNTVFYPFLEGNTNATAEEHNEAFDKFDDYSLFRKDGNPSFVFAYFNLPHQPFVFDEKGNEVSILHQNDWTNKDYYLNQYIYTTSRIRKVVEQILKNDSESVIIIQSDHSARSLQTDKGKYLIDKYDRRHCLNVVYYMGENMQIEGLSGTNTLRLVFGKLLGLDMPELEVPDSEYEF